MPRIPSWPSVNPAELRHSIQVQSQSSTPDSFGQPQQTWTTILTTWARIEALTERELDQADQLTSQVTHTITMRYPSGVSITPGMRAVFGSHIYKIQTANNVDERNVVLKLMCLALNDSE